MSERYPTLIRLIETYLDGEITVEDFIESYQNIWREDPDSVAEGPEFAAEWAAISRLKTARKRGYLTQSEMQAKLRCCYLRIADKQRQRFNFVSQNFVDDVQDWLDGYSNSVEEGDRTATPEYLYNVISEAYAEYRNRVGTDANRVEVCCCATLYYLSRKKGPNLVAENPSETTFPITVFGANGKSLSVVAVVDLDFQGDLALPLEYIEELGLAERDAWTQRVRYPSVNADGYTASHIFHPLYFADVLCGAYRVMASIVPTQGWASVSASFPKTMEDYGRAWAYNNHLGT